MKRNVKDNLAIIILFIVYLFLLIWVIIFKCGIPKEIMGTGFCEEPLKLGPEIEKYMKLTLKDRITYDFYLRHDSFNVLIIDIMLNILCFIPLGIFTSILINKKKVLCCTLLSLSLTLLFEITQLFTRLGSFSFIDMILNFIGAILGLLIYYFLIHFIKKEKQKNIINKVAWTNIIIFIPVLVFAIIFTSINFKFIIFRFNF